MLVDLNPLEMARISFALGATAQSDTLAIVQKLDTAKDADYRGLGLTTVLTDWLNTLGAAFRAGDRPREVESPFGVHGIIYCDEDEAGEGPYAKVGFCIIAAQDNGWYTEIDDGTFGNLQAFRYYFDHP